MRIKYGIFSAFLSLVLILSATYSYKNYTSQKDLLLNKTNEKLYAAAIMAKAILPNNYHDNIVDFNSVSKNEFNDIVDKFNKLCIDLGLEYLWSLMRINGEIVFTSSTSPDKIVANQKHAKFFELHSNPELYHKTFEAQQAQYQHNIDKWGRIQVVLVPFRDSNARPYLFGASIKLSNVDNLLKKSYQESVYLCITFILIGFIFSLVLSKLISDPLNQLAKETSTIASGQFDKIIAEKGFYELVSFKRSFNRMAAAIKQQISAIVKSRNQLSSHINNTPVGVISWDLELIVIDWNPSAELIFGYTRNEAIGKHVQELILPGGEKEVVDRVIYNLISGKGGERQVNENTTKEGKLILCDWYNSVIKDVDGKIVGIASLVNDITERNQLEKINHTMFAISNAVNFSSDLDDLYKQVHKILGGIIDVTNFFIAIISEKKSTLYFPYYVDTVDEDFSPITNFNPKNSLTGLVVSTRKPLLLRKEELQEISKQNGVWGPTPVIWMGVPLIIKDEFIGVIAVQSYTDPSLYRDKDLQILVSISDQVATAIDKKQTEDELKKSEKKYRTLFEKTSDAIFIVNKKTGRYLDVNDSALKLTGRNWQELRKLTTHDIAPKGSEDRLNNINKSKTIQDLGQVIYIRPDGEKRFAVLISIHLDEETAIGIARDITEELILNERLRQSQKMEAIGTLAGGIAHDFNNILSAIFGYSQLAQANIKDSKKAKQDIDQILKGATRAAELVQQILTFSRQTEYQKHRFNLYKGVDEALKLLRSSIPTTIEIVKKLDSQSIVYADPTRIHQVVMNLCTNAYHAMRKSGGTLTVALADVDILESKYLWDKKINPGEYIKFEVSDTGIGMDKNELDKAFEPYFTTKGLGQGTGLGLALVHAIVDEHDSFLDIYSEPGQGTSFYIYFPIVKAEFNNDTSKQAKTQQTIGRESIMVVDDEESIRHSCRRYLQSQGYRVETFSNGNDALKRFETQFVKFDFIITDQTMPGLTGYEFAKKVLRIKSDIPIILCTGYTEDMTRSKTAELGIKKFVQKPIPNQELAVLIREILDQ